MCNGAALNVDGLAFQSVITTSTNHRHSLLLVGMIDIIHGLAMIPTTTTTSYDHHLKVAADI